MSIVEALSVLDFVHLLTNKDKRVISQRCTEHQCDTNLFQTISMDDPFNLTDDHQDFAFGMIDILNNPSFYETSDYDDSDLSDSQTSDSDTDDDSDNDNHHYDDPFFYSKKIPIQEVNTYVKQVDCDYYCSICCSDHLSTDTVNGLQLLCSKNNSCTFCSDCIIPWLTENVAKCPNCATPV